MAEHESYLAVLKSSYDYDPQPDADEELAIKEGQILLLLERTDDDWWKVKAKLDSQDDEGPSGLVPAAYVELAEHVSVVKALYDYEAQQPSELSVNENDILYVYDKDDDWILVRKQSDDSKAGYVPGNYVEEVAGEEPAAAAAPAAPAISQIVVPPSPARPVSTYVDPADRVAAAPTKAQADDIKTWAVSEVDKKGKKKKGTLGIGNGAVFFASESDKTPVRKWQTADVRDVRVEKSKHVHIDIAGAEPAELHFHAGGKDVAEAIVAKLEASRALSAGGAAASDEAAHEPRRTSPHKDKVVHFDAAEPEIIPPREPSDDEDEEEPEGEPAVALYDFTADGEDELSVSEGESLRVLERDGDEWWKCRNTSGGEGVVPASYIELVNAAAAASSPTEDEDAAEAAQAAKEAEERAEAQRQERLREQAERERAEKERKAEAEKRKAAAAAAEVERKRREQERARQAEKAAAAAVAASESSRKKEQRDSADNSESSKSKRSNGDSSGSRASGEKRGPPPENTRVWHDRTGQFRVEAAFLGFANGKLRLHKVNGVVIEVPSEKMSADDLKYIERLTSKRKSSPPRKSDDDEPLEVRRRSLIADGRTAGASKPKKSTYDWFEFFLNAGCDIDDCTRYAQSFERDKIDENLLPDITESTMRSLGLREGDIIRIKKVIEQRQPKKPNNDAVLQEQLRRDEELARQLQAEESAAKPRSPAPNLFAGPNGELKNATMRRGRPQPSKSMTTSSVDLQTISTVSGQMQRTGSPAVSSPDALSPTSSTLVQPPSRAGSAAPAAPVVSGFDDDAWTNRPSSTKPTSSTPPVTAPRVPSAPPAPPVPPAPAPVQAPVASTPLAPASAPPPIAASPPAAQATGPTLAKTDDDIFNQLARLTQIRTQSPAIQTPQRAPSVPISMPAGFQSGMGMGSSPMPMGQALQAQQTGMFASPQPPQFANGPRGPLAPVPANQPLLQPLIPTTTGFNSFVPTRPASVSSPFSNPSPSIQSPFANPSPQPSFLQSQPTGFPGANQPMMPQQTGFPGSGPMMSQPTGFAGGNFSGTGPLMSQPTGMPNGNFGAPNAGGFGSAPSFQPSNGGFGQIQSNPTGFNPGFSGMSPFANGVSSPPPAPPQPAAANTTPANVFAQMKSGTFANDNASGPQGPDKYDALRPQPPLAAQPTGWGYQGMNGGFTGGYGYQH